MLPLVEKRGSIKLPLLEFPSGKISDHQSYLIKNILSLIRHLNMQIYTIYFTADMECFERYKRHIKGY